MIPTGRPFYKMSGSGNDFVVVDARAEPPGRLAEPRVIRRDLRAWHRRRSRRDRVPGAIGRGGGPADVSQRRRLARRFLRQRDAVYDAPGDGARDRLADGDRRSRPTTASSRPESTTPSRRSTFSRCLRSVRPPPTSRPEQGERRIGFAKVGVPHLVILRDDVATVDVVGRGRPLRHHPKLADGANVNFVSKNRYGRWKMRTYERGVEAETLGVRQRRGRHGDPADGLDRGDWRHRARDQVRPSAQGPTSPGRRSLVSEPERRSPRRVRRPAVGDLT